MNIVRNKLNFLNKDIFYYNGNVYEYDIKHAYPSILKDTKFEFNDVDLRYDIERLNEYTNKKKLLIRIGKEIGKNPEIGKYINDKLFEILEEFQLKNNLEEKDIISIKKDALFVTKECKYLKFDNIEFSLKHEFNLYFYELFSKYEYYIKKTYGSLEFSVKGAGNNIDVGLYGNICKLISFTLLNNDLSMVKDIQSLFMKKDINALMKYGPDLLPYNEMIYISKEKLFKDNKINDYENIIEEIYFKHYFNVCKTLINYTL